MYIYTFFLVFRASQVRPLQAESASHAVFITTKACALVRFSAEQRKRSIILASQRWCLRKFHPKIPRPETWIDAGTYLCLWPVQQCWAGLPVSGRGYLSVGMILVTWCDTEELESTFYTQSLGSMFSKGFWERSSVMWPKKNTTCQLFNRLRWATPPLAASSSASSGFHLTEQTRYPSTS